MKLFDKLPKSGLRNTTVRKRILILTTIASFITLSIGGVAVFSLHTIDKNEARLTNLFMNAWGTSAAFERAVRVSAFELQQYELTGDDAMYESAVSRFTKINGEIGELVDYSQRFDVPFIDEQLVGMQEASDQYQHDMKEFYRVSELSGGESTPDLIAAKSAFDASYQDLLDRSLLAHDSSEEGARELATKSSSITSKYSWIINILSVVTILGTLFTGLFISTGLINTLKNIVQRISEGSEQVHSSSEFLTDASQRLAESSSEQAANLEETTSSLEEMASQIKSTADNSHQAENVMNEAKALVESGVESMQKVTLAMEEIKKSSQETSKIIKTIDDIAFQTNLLALNAAVEAARAGESGKGFAVVAEEVRNLAQRSAEAARSTSELIQKSQANSESGSEVAQEASDSLRQIQESSAQVATLIVEISAASKEQASGIDHMTTAMNEMDSVVQSNAAASEESASSAEELSSQANELQRIIAELNALAGGNKNDLAHHEVSLMPQKSMVPNDRMFSAPVKLQKPAAKQETVLASYSEANSSTLIPFDDDDLTGF